ncbi:MAG: PQQ-binding-like beta-propeller repeat protein [Planctomycetales bacterium]
MKYGLRFSLASFVVAMFSAFSAGENWPQFRGPSGNGYVSSSGYPLKWNDSEQVIWKIPIHDRGWSSPVIWDDQIWLTSATTNGNRMFALCIDRETGKILHDKLLFTVEHPQPIAPSNTYASPTPVIEAGRVYVHFGTYGTACLDTKTGEVLWQRTDLKCDHESGAGPGSSPMLVDNLLVFNVDGRDVQYVIALDKQTGETVWKTDRSVDFSKVPVHQRKGYCMPIIVPRGPGRQLVSPGGRAVISYVPETGQELWKIQYAGWSIAPRPIYGHGLLFMIADHDHPELWAIRPDGSGDVTNSHIVWKNTKTMSPRSSPILVDDLIFVVNGEGILSCLQAQTGETVWKKRIAGKYSASPLFADSRLYFFNENSATTVIKPARKFEVLAENRLANEPLMASPAAVDGSFVIRTEKHLYRIGVPRNR